MPSRALRQWTTTCAAVLDEIDAAHAAVRGPRLGRHRTTLRLTHAYALLLAAQFQRFCRELHAETFAEALHSQAIAPALRDVLLLVLTTGRALDRGNASAENIDRDFRPLTPQLWVRTATRDARSGRRRRKLDQLNAWRNAIAHHDFTKLTPSSEKLTLRTVRSWRRACDALAVTFDAVVAESVTQLVGSSPW